MPRNQTVTYLISRLGEIGIRPDAKHGQNFLIDLNLLRLLADSAELGPNDVALEVGTGTGALTELLAERAAEVVTVEIDKHLFELASEVLIDRPNVTMLRRDALKNKNRLDAEVLAAVKEKVEAAPGRRLKLAANLPYNVATPVMSNLLLTEIPPVSMTVTIQRELADRIFARPGTKDYSALSIWMQSQCEGKILRALPPSVFWPRPRVTSAIVQLMVVPEKRARIGDLGAFHDFVRSMFLHRRKFLRGELVAATKGRLDKGAVDAILTDLGLPPDVRAEQLDVDAMLALAEAVRCRG